MYVSSPRRIVATWARASSENCRISSGSSAIGLTAPGAEAQVSDVLVHQSVLDRHLADSGKLQADDFGGREEEVPSGVEPPTEPLDDFEAVLGAEVEQHVLAEDDVLPGHRPRGLVHQV